MTSKDFGGYRWIDKDPCLDLFKTALAQSGKSISEVAASVRCTTHTLYKWNTGGVRKPTRLLFRAVMEDLGYRERWVNNDGSQLEINYEKGPDFGRIIRRRA